MADDGDGETSRRKKPVDRDRPPPVPPRPSFTFAKRPTPLHPTGNSAAQPVDTSDGTKISDDTESGKGPVPRPSRKSTDVSPDNTSPLSAAVNDEVFLARGDSQIERVQDDNLHVKTDLSKDTETEHAGDKVEDGVRVSCEAGTVSRHQMPCSVELQRTGSTNKQTTTNESADHPLSADSVPASSDTGPCDDDVGTPSTAGLDGRDLRMLDAALELNGASEQRVRTQVTDMSQEMANVRLSSQSSPLERSRTSPCAPVARFSDFDDFGLDPDLFRPDNLEVDVPFSEKMAKFTRSASPFYEPMLDEDEGGLSSVLQLA